MRNEVRRKLLIEYAVALVAERESWERLRDPGLTEAERCRLFGEWKRTASGLKQLVRRLRDAEPVHLSESEDTAHAAESSDEASLPRRFHVPWVAARLRLVVRWCARLETAMPRAGSA